MTTQHGAAAEEDGDGDGEYVCGPCQSGKHGASCHDWACTCCEGEGR